MTGLGSKFREVRSLEANFVSWRRRKYAVVLEVSWLVGWFGDMDSAGQGGIGVRGVTGVTGATGATGLAGATRATRVTGVNRGG